MRPLACLAILLLSSGAQEPDAALTQKIRDLIVRLRDRALPVRQKAEEDLFGLGPPILPILRAEEAALKPGDLKSKLGLLIKRIERHRRTLIAVGRTLIVSVSAADKPIVDVLAELQKKTAVPIESRAVAPDDQEGRDGRQGVRPAVLVERDLVVEDAAGRRLDPRLQEIVQTAFQLTDLNIGLLFIFAVTSLGVYGIALAGWASNNKYALFGGLRSSAQMISYELSLSLGVVGALLLAGSLSLNKIVEAQSGYYWGFLPRWNVFQGPWPQALGFLVYLTAAFAETNRIPFDLPEAETELVAGFHTEYSSMKFAMFFMAEYANMITVSCLATVLFLGGWQPPLPESWGVNFVPMPVFWFGALMLFYHSQAHPPGKQRLSMQVFGGIFALIGAAFLLEPVRTLFAAPFWFAAKSGFFLFLYIWIRGTLPRFRYDQLMNFGWKILFPIGIANVLVTGVMVALFG